MSATDQAMMARMLAELPLPRLATPLTRFMERNPSLHAVANHAAYGTARIGDMGPTAALHMVATSLPKHLNPAIKPEHVSARNWFAKQVRHLKDMKRLEERRTFNFPDPTPAGFP